MRLDMVHWKNVNGNFEIGNWKLEAGSWKLNWKMETGNWNLEWPSYNCKLISIIKPSCLVSGRLQVQIQF